MKKTFIHHFKNGDSCSLTLDFTGNKPAVSAIWKNKIKARRFAKIEAEYIQWRDEVFATFYADLTPMNRACVTLMLAKNAGGAKV